MRRVKQNPHSLNSTPVQTKLHSWSINKVQSIKNITESGTIDRVEWSNQLFYIKIEFNGQTSIFSMYYDRWQICIL